MLQVWGEVYEQVITALFFFEVIMIALLAIKKSFAAILVRPQGPEHYRHIPLIGDRMFKLCIEPPDL